MRVKPARGGSNAGGCEPLKSPCRRSSTIARHSAILLSGTAAIALSIAQPASAIVIRDDVAAAFDGIANYYDASNQFPNVVSCSVLAIVHCSLHRLTDQFSDHPHRCPLPFPNDWAYPCRISFASDRRPC